MTDTPARDALDKRTHEVAVELATKSNCCADPSWRNHQCQYHQGVEEGMDLLIEAVAPSLTLAALVEAHGLDEVLLALGGEPQWRRRDPMGSVLTQGWWFPTKETTDVE